jgi:hypothetical protein
MTSTAHWTDVRSSTSVNESSKAQGIVTARTVATATRSANPKPRAKPATATAVSRENASGEFQ